jgi:hypothetical protein
MSSAEAPGDRLPLELRLDRGDAARAHQLRAYCGAEADRPHWLGKPLWQEPQR